MSFPLLSPVEIAESIRGLDYKGGFSPEDVTKPSAVKLQNLYEWFLQYLLQITRDDIRMAAQQQLDVMEFPELYEYSIILGVFHDALSQLMFLATVNDFSSKDLTAPTPERVRRILSGLINFVLFQNEQAQQVLYPLEDRLDELGRQQETLARENAETERAIQERQQQQEDEEQQAQRLRLVNDQSKAELLRLKKEEERLNRAKKEAVDVGKPLKAKITEVAKAVHMTEQEITRLTLRIVQSPEKVRADIDSLSRALEVEREAIEELEEKTRGLESKLRVMGRYDLDLKSCVKVMEEWEGEIARLHEVDEKLRELGDEWEMRGQELKEVDTGLSHANRRIASLQEQLSRSAASGNTKRATTRDRIGKLQAQHRELLEERGQLDDEAMKKQALVTKLEARIRGIAEEAEREVERGTKAYKALKTEILTYSAKLNQALDSLNAFNASV